MTTNKKAKSQTERPQARMEILLTQVAAVLQSKQRSDCPADAKKSQKTVKK